MTSLAPPLPPLPSTTSPVRSLWVRDNDVDPALDPRGTGFADAAPEVLVEHVRERRITEVFLATHGVGDGGPVDEWTARTCRVLRGRRTYVAALGGDLAWLDRGQDAADAAASNPSAPHRWARAALALGPFHRVHLDLAPWTHPAWGEERVSAWDDERAGVWAAYLAAIDAVRDAANGLPLDVDVPWWFATTPDDDGVPLLTSVLARVSRVTVLVDSNRVAGPGGILERLEPSARLCEAREVGFAVGVVVGEHASGAAGTEGAEGREGATVAAGTARATDNSGAADRAFRSLGALDREGAVVREHMRGSTVYRSFAAADYRSWVALLEPHAASPGAIPA